MMEKQQIWIDTYHVNSFDVKPNNSHEAKLTSLLSYFEESAWRHAQNLGFGFYDAAINRNAWVLSRLRIDIFEYPKWGQDFRIKTWPLGVDKLFALRTANFLDMQGNIFASLTSLWLIIDIESRRPQIPSRNPMLQGLNFSDEKNNIPWPEKLIPTSGYKLINKYTTRYSDLDINGHINNTRYAEWICNILQNKQVRNFEINFNHELLLNESVAMHQSEINQNKQSFICKKTDNDKEIFIAEITL